MTTDPRLASLRRLLRPIVPVLAQAADTIIDAEVSKYPIFVLQLEESLELGVPVPIEGISMIEAPIHASTLEEFAIKGIISDEKIDDFRQLYRNHAEDLCVFVLEKIGATFVFIGRTPE